MCCSLSKIEKDYTTSLNLNILAFDISLFLLSMMIFAVIKIISIYFKTYHSSFVLALLLEFQVYKVLEEAKRRGLVKMNSRKYKLANSALARRALNGSRTVADGCRRKKRRSCVRKRRCPVRRRPRRVCVRKMVCRRVCKIRRVCRRK
ncbi:hypothetical protein C0J52_03574 [Blattella germanica]|nr:hypothetical protein C0J52_03574 [Blattella germanica]